MTDNSLKNIQVNIQDQTVAIDGVAINSAKVKQGYAFVCIKGVISDGHKYAKDALASGARVIVAEHEIEGIDKEKVIIVDDTHKAAAEIANQFYGSPSSKMKIIGITGTNGKTTTSNIVSHVITNSGYKCAIIGTTGIFIDGKTADSNQFAFDGRTTPDAISIQELFYHLHLNNVEYVVMEVSSHALDQHRVWSTSFDVCAFTNLSQDHLDYHKTMENYFLAKAKLFSNDYPSSKAICIDDEWGLRLANMIQQQNKSGNHIDYLTCGYSDDAMVNEKNFKVDFPLIGRFNTQNMLVAVSICKLLGFLDQSIMEALVSMPQVDGRMQVVNNQDDKINPKVVVDYSHTPDALEKAAMTLKDICNGKLIVLFGCGGDRDCEKRPKMGIVSVKIADYSIITTDNPRSEEPQTIIDQIVQGVSTIPEAHYEVVVDRAEAINKAINIADNNDIVLLAGKGHENYQEINGEKIHFDDREEARKALYSK